ncbi:hypothetical protein [Nocardioides currus]|uniref:hypothetical protein n=1 Tax=Nocardioides currus TaxID=2133958 RepID=UPI001056EDFB|nr:hypothetical protein [Nocardioides currus]
MGEVVHPGPQPVGRGEPLLDRCRHGAERGAQVRLVRGEEQHGRLYPAHRQLARTGEEREGAAGPEEGEAVERLEAHGIGDEHRHHLARPPAQAVVLGGGETPDHGRRTSVQHTEPEPLLG